MKDMDIDSYFGDFLDDIERFGWNIYKKCLEPLVYVEDHGDELLVSAELPGVDRKNVEVHTTGNTVEIKAKLKKVCKFHRWGTIQREVDFQYFHRVLKLPAIVIPEKSKAVFRKGILHITLPKRHEKKRIEVK